MRKEIHGRRLVLMLLGGIHTRDCYEPFDEKWKDVPPQQKAQIRERLLDWFDIDFEDRDCLFLDVLDRDAKEQYKDWKARLKNHFLTNGTIRPDSVRDDDHWHLCCERFITADFQKKSKTNANNRGKHKYKSRHGRMSYIQRRVLKANAETQQLYSAIENWREMHHDGEKWINEEVERTYNAMVEVLQAPLAQFGFPVDELHVMGNVLGSHRGHRTGVGPTLSRSSRGIPRATQSRTQHASCQTEIKMLRSTLSQVLDVLHQIAPNVQLPNMPPSSSSSAANLCDDDATDSET